MLKLPDRLESKRLIIRPLLNEDLQGLYSFFSNEKATKFMPFTDEQKTLEGSKKLLDAIIESYETDYPVISLAILNKSDNNFIGSLGMMEIPDSDDYEIYYTLIPDFWNNGFATEAITSFLDFVFKHRGIERVFAFINPENTASEKVAVRVGMCFDKIAYHPQFKREGKFYCLTKEKWVEL